MVQVITGLNTTNDPLVAGLDTLASGAEHWTIGVPAGDTIAIDDPGMNGEVPTIALTLNLKSAAPSTLTFTGSSGATPPAPADSIGFTGLVQLTIVNDTGAALNGVLLNLANVDQQSPIDLVPGVIQFGDTPNANYPYFTDIQPGSFAGAMQSLFSPDNKPTTATGAAANSLGLTQPIPAGGTVTGSVIVHDSELGIGNNSFVMNVIPA